MAKFLKYYIIIMFISVTVISCRDPFLANLEYKAELAIITVDAPVVSVVEASNNPTPTWYWTVPPGGKNFRYKLNDPSSEWIKTSGSHITSFTPSDDLEEGVHTLYVQAAGQSGSWSDTAENTTLINLSAPTVHAGSDIDWTNQSVALSGSVEETDEVFTYLWECETEGNSVSFSDTVNLNTTVSAISGVEESYILKLTVTDTYGNYATDTVILNWDSKAPEIPYSDYYPESSGTAMTFHWLSATASSVTGESLSYKIVGSTTNNISTVEDSLRTDNGRFLSMDWTDSVVSGTAGTLASANSYFFTILVKDSTGNIGKYDSKAIYLWDENKQYATGATANNYWGTDVSMSQDGTVVAMSCNNRKSVAVFRNSGSGWNETVAETADDLTSLSYGDFISLSGDGNHLIVGSEGNAVYLFDWNGATWNQSNKFDDPANSVSSSFANSGYLNSDGTKFIIGSLFFENDDSVRTGAAYFYNWNGSSWETTRIEPSDGDYPDRFGYSVSMDDSGELLVIGSPEADTPTSVPGMTSRTGALYLYDWTGTEWSESKIIPEQRVGENNVWDSQFFSGSVSVSGDGQTIAVGANFEYSMGRPGRVFIFEKNGLSWDSQYFSLQDPFDPYDSYDPDNSYDDFLGASVAISKDGNTVLAGAPHYDDTGNTYHYGGLVRYEKQGELWIESMISLSNQEYSGFFAEEVAISADGSVFTASSARDDSAASDAGALYIFE